MNDYVRDYAIDNGDMIPQDFVTAWEDVTDEELELLEEESSARRDNRGNSRRHEQFVILTQEMNPRPFIENTIGARLEEARQAQAERDAARAAEQAKKHAASEKKRLAAEAKERAEFLKLAKKFGNPAATSMGHEQLGLL
jgi:membrane protein involved in colicin uptake